MSDPFEKYLGIYNPVDKFVVTYLVILVLWVLGSSFIRQSHRPAHTQQVQRDFHVLGEEALQHLERGGTISTRRWHGGDLVLQASRRADVLDIRDADEDLEGDDDVDGE